MRQLRVRTGGDGVQFRAQGQPGLVHALVVGQDVRHQGGQQGRVLARGRRLQHGHQVLLFISMVQMGSFIEVLQHRLGRLLRFRRVAVLSQVAQQVLQGRQLLADLVVAMLEHGDGLVKAGNGVEQGSGHGEFSWWAVWGHGDSAACRCVNSAILEYLPAQCPLKWRHAYLHQ